MHFQPFVSDIVNTRLQWRGMESYSKLTCETLYYGMTP